MFEHWSAAFLPDSLPGCKHARLLPCEISVQARGASVRARVSWWAPLSGRALLSSICSSQAADPNAVFCECRLL
eukprot:6201514-Pleurochrysis_carterae.AAC.5